MNDFYSRPGTRRALVPQKQGRAAVKASVVQINLARLSHGGKAIAGAIPQPVKAASRHSIRICGGATAVLAIVALVAVASLYIRLLAGPMSFSFLVPSLQRQLNSQMQGYSLSIGDAILRLSNSWGLEFRLADVSVAGENNQEIAKAPFASIGVSEASLLKLSPAASSINLIGPKLLVFNLPGGGFALTAPPSNQAPNEPSWGTAYRSGARVHAPGIPSQTDAPEIAGVRELAQQALNTQAGAPPFNPALLLQRLFSALEKRGGASSALERIGLKDAVIYCAAENGISSWQVADLHFSLDEKSNGSALRGELTLEHEGNVWQASFRAVNSPYNKLYSVTASIHDIVPRTIWSSFPSFEPLKLINLPVSGDAHFDINYQGELIGGDAAIQLGSGQLYAPFDDKHPATIDEGNIKVIYDQASQAFVVKPFELRWEQSLLTISGKISKHTDPGSNQVSWIADLDGGGTVLGAEEFGVRPVALDALRLSANYQVASDTINLDEFTIQGAGGGVSMRAQMSAIGSSGPITASGIVSPMPISFLKAIWPTFIAKGGREWVGSNVPLGRITGGSFSANLSSAMLAGLDKGGDVPDSAVTLRLPLSGLQIYHIKGLPPIITRDSIVRVNGRRLVYDIPGESRIDVPSGHSISFMDGQLQIEDLRPHFPNAEIRFRGAGEVASVLELLDQPSLGYVKAVGFKPNLINGQVSSAFKIGLPLLKDVKFAQMTLSGKSRVSDIKSNALPGGLSVNGGTVNFEVSEKAIGANGDLKINNVPVSLMWQRIFDAPPERQPTLRFASVLNEKARDELGLNINHIVRGDLPIALAIAMQRDAPPKLFMEANLTNTDVFLTAIGWRKPPGQKATVSFDLSQRADNSLALDNFTMTGDGLNVNGWLVFNDKHRIAGFSFPEFSTNALTKLAITGELTPQNVLKVHAKGPSYDGRQFFRSLLTTGKISENQPAPLKDEPGLDLNVEIDTVFGFYDTSVKSVVIDAKRRGGKLTFLEVAGRLNGEAPMGVHVEQRPPHGRVLISDATDAGSALRLTGFYSAVRGGTMNLRVNLDGSGGAEKTGILEVRRFTVAGDQVVGRVVSQAEREGARYRHDGRTTNQQATSGEPLQFDRMIVPFAVGTNQFQLYDAAINGPIMGATLRGHVDFAHDTISLSGTYIPLYGVNAALGVVPLIGDLLKGRDNEGVFGITFAVQGRTASPDVSVNPAAIFAPGFLRQIFEFNNQPTMQFPQPTAQGPAAQAGGWPASTTH
ncbi:MAG: AsmA-like C-terminal region-containing protein [Rhodomicrobium sp.]